MKTPMRVMVVDDEPLARETVETVLGDQTRFEIVASLGDGKSALAAIRNDPPDILLLDIEMPELRGTDLLEKLGEDERPVTVFITAYEQHALRAFSLRAVDYLLKPYSDEALLKALEGARERVLEKQLARVARRVTEEWIGADEGDENSASDSRGTADRERPAQRITVTRGSTRTLLPVEEIRWIEADDYYARIHSDEGSFLLRRSLTDLEASLDPRRFVRAHRGALVQLNRVREIVRQPHGARLLRLSSGEEIRVARSRVAEVEALIQDELTQPTFR